MRIYVASSWRNSRQPGVVKTLRAVGHEVYDFRHPKPGDNGFHWSEIDPAWRSWSPAEFRNALSNPVAMDGLTTDKAGMEWADAFVLVNPAGRSAHLELGWAIGADLATVILLDDGEPELMYGLADKLCVTIDEVIRHLEQATPVRCYGCGRELAYIGEPCEFFPEGPLGTPELCGRGERRARRTDAS